MITNSKIAWGDQLGAQLTTLAAMIYLGKETNQNVVFWKEVKNFRRGLQFLDVFDVSGIEVISRSGKFTQCLMDRYCAGFKKLGSWQRQMAWICKNQIYSYTDRIVGRLVSLRYRDFQRIKELKNDVHTDPMLLKIPSDGNYDIFYGYGTYQDWKKHEEEIKNALSFKKEIDEKAKHIYKEVSAGKETVAIHFRRTDYLVLASLNLGLDYYEKAMSHFDSEHIRYLVFSDDIEGCKDIDLFRRKDVVFMPPNSAGVDMCLMSLCDNNIIANSTFSFWGAFLGKQKNKVICPRDFAQGWASYLNGNYYPETWTAI